MRFALILCVFCGLFGQLLGKDWESEEKLREYRDLMTNAFQCVNEEFLDPKKVMKELFVSFVDKKTQN
ncbi:unnamed protein product [Oppiella nova]|uniref:Uncharacterized protein n=1 Tax=Oppiella nova TaxID=334625 RepID=A0A7R9M1J1_9ACAR|nr:unnamed protein product [Oppiella nova]CAG2168999.1 unnamed protein product [Oppiella nova]